MSAAMAASRARRSLSNLAQAGSSRATEADRAGEGGRRAQEVGEPLRQRHGLGDQQPQPLGVGAGGNEGALQPHQFVDRRAGGAQVRVDGRVAGLAVEVAEGPTPARPQTGLQTFGRGRSCRLCMKTSPDGIKVEASSAVGDLQALGHCLLTHGPRSAAPSLVSAAPSSPRC